MNGASLNESEWLNEFLKIRVESAGLSKRTTKALVKAGIMNVGGIIRRTAISLREIDGLGESGLNEIQGRFNIPLVSGDNQVSSFDTEWQGLKSNPGNKQETASVHKIHPDEDLRRLPIELSDLSSRTKKALAGVHIRTIGGIIRRMESRNGMGLSGIRGLGVKGINEIKDKISTISTTESIHPNELENTVAESSNHVSSDSIQPSFKFDDKEDIVSVLSEHLGYKKGEIIVRSRKKEIVRARDLIIYMLREYGDMSYPGIGRLLGGRDHTTIIHAHRKIKEEVLVDKLIEKELVGLIDRVKSIKEKKDEIEKKIIPEVIKNLGLQDNSIVPTKLEYKAIPERSQKILELYREGLTLSSISNVFGVTHERVRQIVEKTIAQLAINESVSKGIIMDANVFRDEERKKRDLAIGRKNNTLDVSPATEKEKRWSRYYIACKKCNTTLIPHVRNGLCEQCVGQFRAERRENIIKDHNDTCDSCGVARYESIKLYGRDFYITKDKRVFCRKCFLNESGRKLGSYRNFQWSRFHSQCKKCGTTSIPHSRKGLCESCDTGFTRAKRDNVIMGHGGVCEYCGMTRSEAINKYKRDLYIMKNGKIVCHGCFMTNGFRKNHDQN